MARQLSVKQCQGPECRALRASRDEAQSQVRSLETDVRILRSQLDEAVKRMIALTAHRDALREALELIAAHTSNCIEQCREENNASLLRVHTTVVSVQIMARKALAIVDGAE